jgi:hypothetical protein
MPLDLRGRGFRHPYRSTPRVLSLRRPIDAFTFKIDMLADRSAAQLMDIFVDPTPRSLTGNSGLVRTGQ